MVLCVGVRPCDTTIVLCVRARPCDTAMVLCVIVVTGCDEVTDVAADEGEMVPIEEKTNSLLTLKGKNAKINYTHRNQIFPHDSHDILLL